MWTTIDSRNSIRQAEAILNAQDPTTPRSEQIRSVIEFAWRMVDLAPRVEVNLRYEFPSVTASREEQHRWIVLLAMGEEYQLECWEPQADLDRPPTPARMLTFHSSEQPKWQTLASYLSESWLCRTESWRWIPEREDQPF